MRSRQRAVRAGAGDYVELHARSAFSFLRASSTPEELAVQAARLELPALALTDHNGLYGAPRFFKAASRAGFRPLVGAELTLDGNASSRSLVLLVETSPGYRRLSRLLTRAHLSRPRGSPALSLHELADELADAGPSGPGLIALSREEDPERLAQLEAL